MRARTQRRLPAPRLGIVVIGEGVAHNAYPLFRKLHSHGVYFRNVRATNGRQAVLDALATKSAENILFPTATGRSTAEPPSGLLKR